MSLAQIYRRIPKVWRAPLGILVGVILGTMSGIIARDSYSKDRFDIVFYDLIGSLFLRFLKMLVVPLIFSSLVLAAIEMSKTVGVGRISMRCLLYVICTSSVAVLIGLFTFALIQPGENSYLDPATPSSNLPPPPVTNFSGLRAFTNIILSIAPPNIFDALAKDQMLGILSFSIFLGIAIGKLAPSSTKPPTVQATPQSKSSYRSNLNEADTAIDVKSSRRSNPQSEITIASEKHESKIQLILLFKGIYDCILWMINLVLLFLPLGVACLIAEQTAKSLGDGTLYAKAGKIVSFTATVILGLSIHALLFLPLIIVFIAKKNPFRFFRLIWPCLMTSVSTASTAVSLPVAFQVMEEKVKVSKKLTTFVLPLSVALNMNGSALFECVVILFLANFQGIVLGLQEQVVVVLLSLMTSLGVASVPSASIIAILLIVEALNLRLSSVGSPLILVENIALIMVVNHPLDMMRSCVNMWSDTVCTLVVACLEGERATIMQNEKVREEEEPESCEKKKPLPVIIPLNSGGVSCRSKSILSPKGEESDESPM